MKFLCRMVLFVSVAASAQGLHEAPVVADRPRELAVANSKVFNSVSAQPLMLPVLCDSDQNLYLRFVQSRGGLSSVVKLDSKGTESARYSLQTDADLKASKAQSLSSFFLFDNGIGELARDLNVEYPDFNQYLVIYGKNGEVKSKIKLDVKGSITAAVKFPKGGFLVSGIAFPPKHGEPGGKPYTAILGDSGEFVKNVSFEDDSKIEKYAETNREYTDPGTGGDGNFAVTRGHVTLGADGNVYILRWTTPAIIYAVSAGGEVVRRIEVPPLDPSRKPELIQTDKTYFAVVFSSEQGEDDGAEIDVINMGTGEIAARYTTDQGIALSCYSAPDKFTYLGTDHGKLVVKTLEPH